MKIYETLKTRVEDRVAHISLNRPEKRNALNDVMVVELRDAILHAQNQADIKVIVIKGNGPAFCAGADLSYLQKLQSFTHEQNLADSTALGELFLTIYRATKVIIAQIEGHALAGGCGLATVCDLAYSVPEAKFGYTEVRIGFVPAIVMLFLLRKVGETRAKELLLTGDIIDAHRAEKLGLINRVIPADEIEGYVNELSQRLCTQNSAASMQLTKKMIADIQDFPLENAVGFASRMNAHARATEDCQKGIAAFLNKEKISW